MKTKFTKKHLRAVAFLIKNYESITLSELKLSNNDLYNLTRFGTIFCILCKSVHYNGYNDNCSKCIHSIMDTRKDAPCSYHQTYRSLQSNNVHVYNLRPIKNRIKYYKEQVIPALPKADRDYINSLLKS